MYAILVSVEKTLSSKLAVTNLGKAAYWCVFASSALNPYIYGFRNPQLRKEFQFILCWLCPCVRRGKRTRGCSTTTGSRSSGSGFEYNHIRRPSTPCATPKGRLSVDFAAFPPGGLEKVEMLALQAKLSNYSSDPGYCSQDEHGAFCSENGTNDDNNINNSNNNNCKNEDGNDSKENQSNNSLSTEPTRSHGNFLENLANETSIPNSKSDKESFTEERSAVLGSSINQGFTSDNHVENSIATPADDQETEIEISRSSIQADSPDGDDAVLLTPARTRGWSLRTLGARLNLGWIEITL